MGVGYILFLPESTEGAAEGSTTAMGQGANYKSFIRKKDDSDSFR